MTVDHLGNQVSYRQPRRDELSRLGDLGAELFTDTFGHLYAAHDLAAFLQRVFSLESMTADFESGRQFWIAEQDGNWIGYCKMGPLSLPVETHGRRALELKQMYVRRDYHGQGVAKELMLKFLQWGVSHAAEDLYISCWSENHRALAFYRRFGFEVIGAYTFWVGSHGDDERILKHQLTG